jgi:hypothetical protein
MPNNYYTILQADLWVLVTVIQEEADLDFSIHHMIYTTWLKGLPAAA